MMDSIQLPLAQLCRGFYDVVPLAVLAGDGGSGGGGGGGGGGAPDPRLKLDAQELEVALFGSPAIDVADWKAHTDYGNGLTAASGTGRFFWEVVEKDFNAEQRTRLLQFVTGTSRLPAGGFKDLQGVDGKAIPFKLLGVPGGHGAAPQAHTCFNRLDLPAYTSRAHMKEVLTNLVAADIEGFSIS